MTSWVLEVVLDFCFDAFLTRQFLHTLHGFKKIDEDIDLQTIKYSCLFDQSIDGSVTKEKKANECLTLKGIDFDRFYF